MANYVCCAQVEQSTLGIQVSVASCTTGQFILLSFNLEIPLVKGLYDSVCFAALGPGKFAEYFLKLTDVGSLKYLK